MILSKTALWMTRHWPISSIGFAWPVYIRLIRVGGPAFVRELYPDGIPQMPQASVEVRRD